MQPIEKIFFLKKGGNGYYLKRRLQEAKGFSCF